MRSIKKLKSAGKAVAGSALLVGATLTGAAGLAAAQDSGSSMDLGEYPAPFVDDAGNVDATIAVGSTGQQADVVGAINVAGSLGNAAFAEEEKSAGGASAGWSVSGDGATVSTENTQVYFTEDISNKDGLQTTMTDDELSVLESGTVTVENEDHNYDQYVNLAGLSSQIGNSGGDLDDAQMITDLGTSAGDAYTATVTFDKALNITDASDDDETINLFGNEYTIADESDISENSGDTLVLFGDEQSQRVDEGESQTVTVDGTEVTLETDSVTGDNSANVILDGESESGVSEDDTFSVSGIEEDIRVKDIVYRGELDYGERGYVTFSIGSEKLTLQNGASVKTGSSEEEIDNTRVVFNGDAGAKEVDVSKMEIEVAAQDGEEDHLAVGEEFEDPVFGTFSLAFSGSNPAPDADSRSMIEASVSGDDTGTLEVTDSNGNEATFNLATDANPGSSGNAADLSLYSDDYQWNLTENATMHENSRFVINRGDFTHVLEVANIEGNSQGDEIEFDDVFSGTTYTATLDSNGQDELFIDGQEYFVNATTSTGVSVTWGSNSATHADPGDEVTVFPTFNEENDAEVALTAPDQVVTVDNSTVIELPTGTLNVTEDISGMAVGDGSDGADTNKTVGSVEYEIKETDNGVGVSSDISVSLASSLDKPATLVVEEEADSGSQNALVLTYGDDSDGITVSAPTFTDGDADTANALDNDDQISMDTFGTYSVHDADDDEFTRVHYPDTQATMGFGVVGDGDLSASGGAGSVTTQTPTGWPDSAALDTDVTGSEKNENLILVGGPAVNTLVEELANDNMTMSAGEYEEDQYVLDLTEGFDGDGGSKALVVAGHSAEDTVAASNFIANYADNSDELAGQASVKKTTAAQ